MSGGEVGKRQKEVRKNANTRATDLKAITSDMDHASLGETSSEDEFHPDGRDGSYPRRWSSEEDARLRSAVEKYHEANWKEIALEVGTRNHVQCLQRWKKVLTPGLVKGQWSRKEDELLVSLVNEGHKNWGALAAHVPGRTSKQCRERWCHHLDPRIVKGDWTEEEDQIILSMHEEIGNKWATIAQSLNGRTENATKIRWKILQRSMKHDEERQGSTHQPPRLSSGRHGTDERLRCLAAQAAASAMSKAKNSVQPIGMPENPEAVRDVLAQESVGHVDIQSLPEKRRSLQIQGKSPAHDFGNEELGYGNGCLKKRKLNDNEDSAFADEEIDSTRSKREPNATVHGEGGRTGRRGWLRDEDDRLKLAVDKLGDRSWRQVAEIVGTRTHIQCQQRWKKALRPGLIKGAWSVEEDENLMKLISKGFSNWTELASHTPGRTAKQCRERWCHHLDPSVNHGSWTEEEDQQLLALQVRLGTKWSAIAREMPGRTEHAVKGRVKTLSRCQRVGGTAVSRPNVDNMALKKKRPEERFGIRQRGIGCSERHSVLSSLQAASGETALKNGVDFEARWLSEAPENSAISSISLLAPLPPEKSIGANQSQSMVLCTTDPLLDRPCPAGGAEFVQGQQQQRGTEIALPELQLLHEYQQDSQVMHREDSTKPQTQFNVNQCLSQPQDSTEKVLTSVLGTGVRVEDGARNIVTSDGESIAKLLSISSADVESLPGLTEESVTSGCCGGAMAALQKASTPYEQLATRGGYPCQEQGVVIDSFRLPRQDGAPTAPIQRREEHQHNHLQDFSQPLPPPGASTSRSGSMAAVLQIANPDVAPFPDIPLVTPPVAEDCKIPQMPANTHISSVGTPAAPNMDMHAATEASLLANKPNEVDYSDLASFLTESFDARQDGLGEGIESVSLGDDPYSDYYGTSSYGTVNFVQYPPEVRETREGKAPAVLVGISQEHGQGSALNTDVAPTATWDESEALVALGVADACDPYF